LERGTDEGVLAYYNSRPSLCSFLQDPGHYERPRIEWILDRARGGRLLEIGCADGGLTELLSRQVEEIVALDACQASITALRNRRIPNITTHPTLAEAFEPGGRFDWIVMSEFLEHVRNPAGLVTRAVQWLAPGGRLLASSPDGRWGDDSIEHLQVFDLASWTALFVTSGGRSIRVFRIRDREGRDRWLGADVSAD
jgi:2-polyprenyl-3-methyl-5-hydroxy-6-metoxy-1,4-benzoquinol methylase